jgi:hypothetical protein
VIEVYIHCIAFKDKSNSFDGVKQPEGAVPGGKIRPLKAIFTPVKENMPPGPEADTIFFETA